MIEPSELQEHARRYESENLKFRRFLKNRADEDELDRQFAELHNELFATYDCCQCHNCCEQSFTQWTDEETERIAGFLGLSKDAFIRKYLQDGDEGYGLEPPCPFLEINGTCQIQPYKPNECRGYPYTDQPDRIGSLYGVLGFAEVCPVVFEILQRLKEIYGFRSRVRL
jgi:Fe-S-cluster containining protein